MLFCSARSPRHIYLRVMIFFTNFVIIATTIIPSIMRTTVDCMRIKVGDDNLLLQRIKMDGHDASDTHKIKHVFAQRMAAHYVEVLIVHKMFQKERKPAPYSLHCERTKINNYKNLCCPHSIQQTIPKTFFSSQ